MRVVVGGGASSSMIVVVSKYVQVIIVGLYGYHVICSVM